jgi:hypothetical protein
LPDSAQKTADPFLKQGFSFTQARQKTMSGLGVAQRANIEAMLKRGDFLECAELANTLPSWQNTGCDSSNRLPRVG